jgi:hypothetical protein
MMKQAAFVLGVVLALMASGAGAADGKRLTSVPLPRVNIEQDGKCVEPTDVMRRNHMKFMLHQRDKTMHEGVRTTQHSLKNCVNCHASKTTNSVLGKDGFCQACHTYAAVSIDCFTCHTDKRNAAAPLAAGLTAPAKETTP